MTEARLTPGRKKWLERIARGDGATLQQLLDEMGGKRRANLMPRLVREGLARYTFVPEANGKVRYELTEAGRRALEQEG